MKKFLSILALIVLSFNGCSLFSSDKNVSEIRYSEDVKAYLLRETDAEMSYAGPFYFGNFDGFDVNSREYSVLRKAKVDEILEIMSESVDLMKDIDKKLREERNLFADYVGKIKTIEKKAKNYTNKLLTATNITPLSSALSELIGMEYSAEKTNIGSVYGHLQFQRFASIFSLTELYTIEASSLVNRAVSLYYLLEADKSNPEFQKINADFIVKMDPLSEEINDLLNELYYRNALLVHGRKVLFSADLDFAKKTLISFDQKLLEAKNSFDNYKGENENFSSEMLELLKKKLADLEAYKSEISSLISELSSDPLIISAEIVASSNEFRVLPVANADDLASYFQQKIKDAIKTAKFAKDMTFAAVRVTGQKLKDTYDSSGAHEVVKDGAQILNGGLEIVNSGVEVSIYGIQGIYFGDTDLEDMKRRIEQEKNELHERFIKGTLGKDQYDEMIHQVDQFQKNTGSFINNMSEFAGDMSGILTKPEVGNFVRNVTRGVGNEAKKVLDTATDFTKNLAIVMHPETSKEDTRNAMLNIYLALKATKDKDGKWVEVEMPDLIELAKEQAKKELGLSEEEEKEFVEQLTEVFQEQLKAEESKKEATKKTDSKKKVEEQTIDAVAAILNNSNLSEEEKADLILEEIVKGSPSKGGDKEKKSSILDIDGDGIKNEDDNCPQESNADQADFDKDAIGNICDPDCSGDSDGDGICNELDNCPNIANPDQKDSNKNGIGDLCDDSAPELSEVEKELEGEMTITDVYISEAARADLTKQGCDVSSLEEKKGTKNPASVKVKPSGDDSGDIMFYLGEDPLTVPFIYEDGVLSGSTKQEGATINVSLDYNSDKPTGTLEVLYLEGEASLKGDLSF